MLTLALRMIRADLLLVLNIFLGGHVLYSFNGHLVYGSGSSLHDIKEMMSHTFDNCRVTLVFRSPIDIEHLRSKTKLKVS